jgi:hypothetical protein
MRLGFQWMILFSRRYGLICLIFNLSENRAASPSRTMIFGSLLGPPVPDFWRGSGNATPQFTVVREDESFTYVPSLRLRIVSLTRNDSGVLVFAINTA